MKLQTSVFLGGAIVLAFAVAPASAQIRLPTASQTASCLTPKLPYTQCQRGLASQCFTTSFLDLKGQCQTRTNCLPTGQRCVVRRG